MALFEREDEFRSDAASRALSVTAVENDFVESVYEKLAKVYANMTPESAATVLGELDDQGIAKIVVFMKDAEMAAIFEAWSKKGQAESKRAAALSERLRLASFRNNKTQ